MGKIKPHSLETNLNLVKSQKDGDENNTPI